MTTHPQQIEERILKAHRSVQKVIGERRIDAAVILGSGLGDAISSWESVCQLNYDQIDGFPKATSIQGHAGCLKLCEVTKGDKKQHVLVMQGRFHFYEGFDFQEVTIPVRLMHHLGVKRLVVTCAAGGLQKSMQAGDLMMIVDHINLMGGSPLRGANLEVYGTRFPDMSEPYSKKLSEICERAAERADVGLKRGVYAAVSGPQYETAAEINMLGRLGADAVGMSTVPEVIVAGHQGTAVLGIAIIANLASGLQPEGHTLSHDEVIATGKATATKLGRLLHEFIFSLD